MTNNSIRITYFSLVNFKQVEFNQERAKLEQSTLISVFIPTFVTFSHQKSINSLQHFVISPHYWSIQLICEFTNICVCTGTTKLISKILSASTLAGNKKSLFEKKTHKRIFQVSLLMKIIFALYTRTSSYTLPNKASACLQLCVVHVVDNSHVCVYNFILVSVWFSIKIYGFLQYRSIEKRQSVSFHFIFEIQPLVN